MADINFDCPHCGQNLDAPPDMAGESLECPACEEAITVPAPPRAAQPGKKRVVIKKARAPRRPSSTAARPAPGKAPRATPAKAVPAAAPAVGDVSAKSRTVTLLLCWFLGPLGVHRFYTGKTGTGVVQILTVGGLGVWVLIDFIMIIAGAFKDKSGLPVKNW